MAPHKKSSDYILKPGFKQFLSQRKDMLAAFDSAQIKAQGHKTETFHGKVAEAQFRKWLASFLPTRYGVTSGYIVSNGAKEGEKLIHFDVIIYDQIESPILWLDETPDQSEAGKSKAIPVEHVLCVLEVKSQLSKKTFKEAIEHLSELSPLMKLDEPSQRYKIYLPQQFSCGVIFFDLLKKNENSKDALKSMYNGFDLRGFFGGLVLRGQGHTKSLSGRLEYFYSDQKMSGNMGKDKNTLLSSVMIESFEVDTGKHLAGMLHWQQMNFARFAFDLIAKLKGNYDPGFMSSFYGFGFDDQS